MSEPTADTSSTAGGMKLPDTYAPPDAINLNVKVVKNWLAGLRLLASFGNKTYRIRLIGSRPLRAKSLGAGKPTSTLLAERQQLHGFAAGH